MLLFDSKNAAFLNDVSIVKSFVLTLNTNENFCFLFQNSFQFDFFMIWWFGFCAAGTSSFDIICVDGRDVVRFDLE